MRLTVHDLYSQHTFPLEADDEQALEGMLVHLYPDHALEVDPEEGLEALVEHLNLTLQGVEITIEPFDSMTKAQEPPLFPKLGVQNQSPDVDRVSTGRNLEMKARLIEHASKRGQPWERQRPEHAADVERRIKNTADPSHRGAMFQVAGYKNAPRGPGTVQDPTTVTRIGYAKDGPLALHPDAVEGTFQHERFHAMMTQVESAHGPHSRTMLADNLYDALPEQYKPHLDRFFRAMTGGNHIGRPNESEERLARIFNYVNSGSDRERFHYNHFDRHNERMQVDRAHKRALQALRAISEVADRRWLRPLAPWKKSEHLAKNKPGPKLPKLGFPDDRRETNLVTTGRQLDITARTFLGGVRRSGRAPDLEQMSPEHQVAQVRNEVSSVSGASDYYGSGSRSFALGMGLRAPAGRGNLSGVENADRATLLHEDLHNMFKRVQGKYGDSGRRNLARNMFLQLSLRHPDEMSTLKEYMRDRYPNVWRTVAPEEEHFATLLNYLNTPGERKVWHDYKQHPEETRWMYHKDLNTLHRAVLKLGHEADKTWLLEPSHRSKIEWDKIEALEREAARRPAHQLDLLGHLGLKKNEDLEKVSLTPESTADRMRPHEPTRYQSYHRVETYKVPEPYKHRHSGTEIPLWHHVFYDEPSQETGYQSVMHVLSPDENPPPHGSVWASSASGVYTAGNHRLFQPEENLPWRDGQYVKHGETATTSPGGGLGTILYKQMARVHGRMASDTSTSAGANGVWEKLVKDPEFRGALGYEKGHVHWVEHTGERPSPHRVIEGDGRSWGAQLDQPEHPYRFEVKSFGTKGPHEFVEVHGYHKDTGEHVGGRGLHLDHAQKRIYQEPTFRGGFHHFAYEHKDAAGPALHEVRKQTGYSFAGDLPVDDVKKAQTTIKFPTLGMPDNRRETPIVTTDAQEHVKTRAIANSVARADPYRNLRGTPEARVAAVDRAHETVTRSPRPLGQVSTNAATTASYARGEGLVGKEHHDGKSTLAVKQHEDLHHMFNRVERKYGSNARQWLSNNLVNSLPPDLERATQHWRDLLGQRHAEEEIASFLNYLQDPKLREVYANTLRSKGKGDADIRAHDQAMKSAWRHFQQMSTQVDESWFKHKSFQKSEQHWHTPEFKSWFGNSHVKHPDGKPLVVFHGSPKGGFAAFDPDKAAETHAGGIYFTNHVWHAQTYSGSKRDAQFHEDQENFHPDYDGEPGNYACYLSLKNPYKVDFGGRAWDGGGEDGSYDHDLHINNVVREAKTLGHDGVIATNINDEGPHGHGYCWGDTTYVAFHPHQIKSATHNVGTYSPHEPDIRKQSLKMSKSEPIRPDWNTPSEPGYVYHATNTERAHDIAAAGHLRVHRPHEFTDQDVWPDGATEKRNYWSDKAHVVHSFAPEDGQPVILRARHDAHPFKRESTGDIYSTKPVPAQHLEILTGDGWMPLKHWSQPVQMSKSEGNLLFGSHREVVEDMHGYQPHLHSAFAAARYLTGGGHVPTIDMMRRALWEHDDDMEAAALHAHGVEVTDSNRKALRHVQKYSSLGKAEAPDLGGEAQAGTHSAEDAAKNVNAGISERNVEQVRLGGRHSAGSMLVHSGSDIYLLKPGSGGQSPAAGAKDDTVSQSRREAAFWHVANAWGLGDDIPRADLLHIGGREYAAIEMLGFDWKNLAKVQMNEPERVIHALDRYREIGTLHRWAILDFILGNPDRHGQNLMVSPEGQIKLIDHGSAFAGEGFDPANDKDSFVPYYLRAQVRQDRFNALKVADKLRYMPTLHPNVEREVRDWLMKLDSQWTAQTCQEFGINPGPVLQRLERVKAIQGPVDAGINRLWVTV